MGELGPLRKLMGRMKSQPSIDPVSCELAGQASDKALGAVLLGPRQSLFFDPLRRR
jgi:hypothetical protein